jgi:hypothetical protein
MLTATDDMPLVADSFVNIEPEIHIADLGSALYRGHRLRGTRWCGSYQHGPHRALSELRSY